MQYETSVPIFGRKWIRFMSVQILFNVMNEARMLELSQPSEKTSSSLLFLHPNQSLAFTPTWARIWVLSLGSAFLHPQFSFYPDISSPFVFQWSNFFALLKTSCVIKIPRQFTYQPRKHLAHLGVSALDPSSYVGNTAIIFNKHYRKIQQHQYRGDEASMLLTAS